MKELILKFLQEWAVKCAKDEDDATTKLYIDNHYYIEFENQGYYIPEDTNLMEENDSLLKLMILNTFEV